MADAAKANAAAKLVISGYHDASGDPAQNAELAKQRAMAVRDALKTAGVAEDRIELKVGRTDLPAAMARFPQKGAGPSSFPGPAAGVAPCYESRIHSRVQWSISPEPEETP